MVMLTESVGLIFDISGLQKEQYNLKSRASTRFLCSGSAVDILAKRSAFLPLRLQQPSVYAP